MSCRRGKASGISESGSEIKDGSVRVRGRFGQGHVSGGKQIRAAPAAITALQTIDADDEDRPVVVTDEMDAAR